MSLLIQASAITLQSPSMMIRTVIAPLFRYGETLVIQVDVLVVMNGVKVQQKDPLAAAFAAADN
jgi:hypothetical protein